MLFPSVLQGVLPCGLVSLKVDFAALAIEVVIPYDQQNQPIPYACHNRAQLMLMTLRFF